MTTTDDTLTPVRVMAANKIQMSTGLNPLAENNGIRRTGLAGHNICSTAGLRQILDNENFAVLSLHFKKFHD